MSRKESTGISTVSPIRGRKPYLVLLSHVQGDAMLSGATVCDLTKEDKKGQRIRYGKKQR